MEQTQHCERCTELEQSRAIEDPVIRRGQGLPSNWWHCRKCGTHLERYRGQGDQNCYCGAWYNASGQRLRDDWYGNASNFDDEISDLEGFEAQQLAAEPEWG